MTATIETALATFATISTVGGAVLATTWKLASRLTAIDSKLSHLSERVERLEPQVSYRKKAQSHP